MSLHPVGSNSDNTTYILLNTQQKVTFAGTFNICQLLVFALVKVSFLEDKQTSVSEEELRLAKDLSRNKIDLGI